MIALVMYFRRSIYIGLLVFCYMSLMSSGVNANTCTSPTGVGIYLFSNARKCVYNTQEMIWECVNYPFGQGDWCAFPGSSQCGIYSIRDEYTDCVVSADKSSCTPTNFVPKGTFLSPAPSCTLCITVNGNCNSEDYPDGVCNYDDMTKKCDSGVLLTIDSVGNDGYFNWKCLGNSCSDSVDVSCSVPKLPTVNGVCGTAINTCDSGTVSGVGTSVTDTGMVNVWTCNGSCGGDNPICTSPLCDRVDPITGDCGDFANIPATGIRCDVGTMDNNYRIRVVGVGESYAWQCVGTDGSCPTVTITPVPCRSFACNAVNGDPGMCKSGLGTTYPEDFCFSGNLEYNVADANHDYISDTDSTRYIWNCIGTSGICSGISGTSQLNCTSIIDQEAWFRASGGGVLAGNKVDNYIPMTCENNCKTANQGIVWASEVDLSDKDGSERKIGFSNFKRYYYNSLINRYYYTKGVGTTVSGSKNWSEIRDTRGIVFVDGDLTIDENIDTNDLLILIVSGKIVINQSVNSIDGALFGLEIIAEGESADQLRIEGMVYGKSGVKFSRSFLPKIGNNTQPAVEVVYNPNLIFKIPKEAGRVTTQWRMN